MNSEPTPENIKIYPPRKAQTASHLQALITSMEDIVFEIDGNQVFKNVWVNDETMLFMPSNEFLHKKVGDVMGKYAERFSKAINKVITSGDAKEMEYKHIQEDSNEWFNVKIKPVFKSEDLDQYILVLIIQNITKQKSDALKLKKTKKRLELSIDLMRVSQHLSGTSGWELDVRTGVFSWTEQNYVLFEVGPDFSPKLQTVLPFFLEKDKATLERSIKEAIDQKINYELELKIITAKGKEKWVHAIAKPILKRGKVVALMGAFMDITLKKRNELALINLKNIAEEATKAKSKFLSIMSHEIRTPLHGIIGITDLLKLHHTPEQEDYIKNLIFSANHLLMLVNDVLDFNKFEDDHLELWPKNIDLFQLAKNIINQFKSLAEAKGIQLRTLLDEELPRNVSVDPIRLGQILNNLISNSIKFTDTGEVLLTIQLISMEEHRALIHFSVKDTGFGIPKEFHANLFESFKQPKQSHYPNPSGTGLGLSITDKLLKAHNSKLFFKSEPGKGSEFYFDLPLTQLTYPENTSPFMGSTEFQDQLKLTGLEVLVVEDNPINTLIAQKQLEQFGLSPDCVDSSEKAMAIIQEKNYHIALVDLHLPRIDGYALAKWIQEQFPDTHLIIFTADVMDDVKDRLAKMGIYDVLTKPFSQENMFEKLLKVAQKKGLVNLHIS